MKKRLRKKLRKGEFKELGFELKFDYTGDTDNSEVFDLFLDDFIAAVERYGMYVGGGGAAQHDYFVYAQGQSVTDDQRWAIVDWLEKRTDVSNVIAGELRDVWYGWGKD